MRRGLRPSAAVVFALALGACQGRVDTDRAFGERVRAWLLAHPEVLVEMSQKLDARNAAADEAARRRAQGQIPALRARIERDAGDFVANPQGRITVTEFYDYRCPHCANAAPQVLAMIRASPEVRFVFKESPIFGRVSEHAARAALAVRAAGGDSLGLYQALMSAHGLDDPTIERLAMQHGARPADLASAAAAGQNAQLARTAELFSRLNLEGTPAFIVGDRIILGEDVAAVRSAVAALQAGAAPGARSAGA